MRDPYDLCAKLLDLVVEGFKTRDVDLPETRYVAAGGHVAYDGEQVTVNVLRLFSGQPGAERPVQMAPLSVRSLEMLAAVVRDAPVLDENGSAPPVEHLQASARENLLDLVTMRDVMEEIRRDNLMVDGGNTPFIVGPCMPQGPQGGIVAVTCAIQILLG